MARITSEDRAFDPQIFQQNRLYLYRLVRAKYADLSGMGASLNPGRWNRSGQKAIYTSTEVGVTLLERLAHSAKEIIPSNLVMMTIRVDGDWIYREEDMFDQKRGGNFTFCKTIQSARDYLQGRPPFNAFLKPFALAVPSVIAPAWNVVLYPDGTSFWKHVAIDSIEPFDFDPRLFPEGAAIETAE